MAGAGYKLFNTGDVLTAAQVNTYLQEQTVMVFASSTARTTALSGVLAEGMMSYLQDTNSVEVYNGSSWVNVGNAGDLTEIVAGTGITVTSGTGPIPTVALTTPVAATNGGTAQSTYTTGDLLYASATNTLAKRAIGSTDQVLKVSGGIPTWAVDPTTDVVTTAGDLIYATGADAVTRLGIGTAGQVLTVNSGATAPEWKTASGGGKVLQVVQAQTTTATTIATTTYTDTTITATITPSATSSKILVIINGQCRYNRNSTAIGLGALVKRGATTIVDYADYGLAYTQVTGATYVANGGTFNVAYLDSPSTTSATTYKLQGKISTTADSGTSTWQADAPSQIILMEIGA